METNEQLAERISKLEKQSTIRFTIEIVLIPILLLVGKIYGDYLLQIAKEESQQIELAQKIMPDLFKDDPYVAFANERLLVKTLDSKNNRSLAEEVRQIVEGSLLRRVESYVKSGKVEDLEAAESIVSAANLVGGNTAERFLKEYEKWKSNQPQLATKINNLRDASQFERDGFQALLAGKYDEAIAAFETAEKKFPMYHNVFEISNLLKNERNNLLNDKISAETRKRVVSKIVKEFSWKAPDDLIEKLKFSIQ